MTLLNQPAVWRDVLEFYMFILAGTAVFGAISSRHQGEKIRAGISAVMFLAAFALNCMLMIVSEHVMYQTDEEKVPGVAAMPVWLVLVISVVMTGVMAVILIRCLVGNHQHIGPSAIKESMDYLPSGIAIYDENGNCMIVNNRMNRLSAQLTGHAVLDGKELYRAVLEQNKLVVADGHSYAFSCKTIEYQGTELQELIADDVTEILKKSEELREGNEQLKEYSQKMRQYGTTIDETVRNEEILQAKVNIHDEMNRLLLATGNAASNGVSQEELQKILRTWQNNALLLCREADANPKTNTMNDMETLGKLIGITPVWEGTVQTNNPEILRVFSAVTREAMTNAVKHAGAKHLFVQMRTVPDAFYMTYSNDGEGAVGNIVPGGGLSNLQEMVEHAGGEITFSANPTFVIRVRLPKGGT